ncbi:MAG TPA: ABC transporter permease [Candidatus Polarisedimenticolia bacterium]|nr:ABC transporter permease [Candidatus Polarisedimenticolia bacterium]
MQDLRFGARMLRKNPGFAIAAIFTLALGIGGNTAIFTVTSSVLLKALPYQAPQQLISLDAQSKDGQSHCCTLNRFDLVRDRSQSFSGVVAAASDNFNLTGRGEPVQVPSARVSANFFDLLGVKPQLGRFFVPDEGQPAGKPVIVISDSLWHTRFGGDPSVLNQAIALDGAPYNIIGVLPAGIQFPFLAPADVWSPRYFEHSLFTPQRLRMGVGYLSIIGRLRPGVSRDRAVAEMNLLHQQYHQENPAAPDADAGLSMIVTDLQDSVVANIRGMLLMLSGAVGVVLLIACANVASLLLSRALSRRKEFAVRAALGAQRSALIRQLLTESVLLAFLGGLLGLGLSWAATRYFATLGNNNLPQGMPITMDARVLLFMLAISILTGILFGIFPALQLSRTNVNQTLRDEGRGSTGGHRRMQLRGLLVVGQVALSLMLLIGAGLLVRSFSRLLRVEPGFDPQNVLTMNVSLPTVKYADAQKQIAFFDDLSRRVSALPGVRSAAISAALPLIPKRITPVLPEGQPEVSLAERPFIIIEAISPAWFRTMRVPLQAGREFADADNAQAPKVVIVNQVLARRYWPNENPVGKHILVGRQNASEIVGVAVDVKNRGLALDAAPQLYLPFPQLPWGNMNLLVRTAANPNAMASAVRAQVAAVDSDQPVTNIQTVDEIVDGSRAQPRFILLLLGVFSAVALVLAIIGIYGVLAYSVAQRRQEMGIRLALGADKSDILRMVVSYGLTLTMTGVVIGLVAALALSWIMTSMLSGLLYKISVRDLTTFVLAPVAFLAISLLASYLPARRATQVDPNEALRSN